MGSSSEDRKRSLMMRLTNTSEEFSRSCLNRLKESEFGDVLDYEEEEEDQNFRQIASFLSDSITGWVKTLIRSKIKDVDEESLTDLINSSHKDNLAIISSNNVRMI